MKDWMKTKPIFNTWGAADKDNLLAIFKFIGVPVVLAEKVEWCDIQKPFIVNLGPANGDINKRDRLEPASLQTVVYVLYGYLISKLF